MWESDLAAVRARASQLHRDGEVEAARSLVQRWRVARGSWRFAHPAPLIAHPRIALEGEWAPYAVPDFGDDLVGLDGLGRPRIVLVYSGDDRWERALRVFTWWQDGFEEIDLHGPEIEVHRYRLVDGRVVHRVSAAGGGGEVALVSWDGDRPVRLDGAAVGADGRTTAQARTATYDEADHPIVIRRAYTVLAESDDLAPAARSLDDARRIGSALTHAATLPTANIQWDGRILRPTPPPADPSSLVEPLAAALCDAIAAAVSEAVCIEPFCVEVDHRRDGPSLPPFVNIGGRAFRDRLRTASGYDHLAIAQLRSGAATGDVLFDDLVERLDEPALRACRALSTAAERGSRADDLDANVAVVQSLGDRLAQLLFEREWPGTTDPFLALVSVTDFPGHGAMGLAFGRALAGAGLQHVERFLASTASHAKRPAPDLVGRRVAAARVDRAALAVLLEQHGLAAHAEHLAHDVAEVGLQVWPATDGRTRSRLGGPALLPRGQPWPTLRSGRPLSFLAGLDLTEVRASGGDDRLPTEGWLLFFADLEDDEEGLADCATNEQGMPARVLVAAGDQSPVEVPVPVALTAGDGLVLTARPVMFDACLTLSRDHAAADRLGLDWYEARSYDEVLEVLESGTAVSHSAVPGASELKKLLSAAAEDAGREGDWSEEGWRAQTTEAPPSLTFHATHWVGGLATGVQGHSPEADTVLLLHIAFDYELGFEFLDGGAIQFRIPAAALAVGDWSQATAEADGG